MLERVAAAWSTMDIEKVVPFYAKDPGLVFFDVVPLKNVGWSATQTPAKGLMVVTFDNKNGAHEADLIHVAAIGAPSSR